MESILFIVRTAGAALATVVGGKLMAKVLVPSSANLITGAIHFKNALYEFQEGARVVLFGPRQVDAKTQKRSTRIQID